MIAIPQCLDFSDVRLTKEICDFYLKMLQIKNREIYLHSQQVANYAASTAAKLGLPASEVSQIKTGALLHDIGQLSVPNLILAKLPFLSTRELSIYKRHCIAGASMLDIYLYHGHYPLPPRKMGRHRLSQALEGTKHSHWCPHCGRGQLL